MPLVSEILIFTILNFCDEQENKIVWFQKTSITIPRRVIVYSKGERGFKSIKLRYGYFWNKAIYSLCTVVTVAFFEDFLQLYSAHDDLIVCDMSQFLKCWQ